MVNEVLQGRLIFLGVASLVFTFAARLDQNFNLTAILIQTAFIFDVMLNA